MEMRDLISPLREENFPNTAEKINRKLPLSNGAT